MSIETSAVGFLRLSLFYRQSRERRVSAVSPMPLRSIPSGSLLGLSFLTVDRAAHLADPTSVMTPHNGRSEWPEIYEFTNPDAVMPGKQRHQSKYSICTFHLLT